MTTPLLDLAWTDWLGVFGQFLLLSLLSVGGVVTAIPDMHRYLVESRHWLTDLQFNGSIAIAQASPGPNVLFVGLLAWNVGISAGGIWHGLFAVVLLMTAILLPSSLIAYTVTRWLHRNRGLRSVRAFKQGMTPISVALMFATAWIMAGAQGNPLQATPSWLLALASALIIWRTKLHLLWLLGGGALLGLLHVV